MARRNPPSGRRAPRRKSRRENERAAQQRPTATTRARVTETRTATRSRTPDPVRNVPEVRKPGKRSPRAPAMPSKGKTDPERNMKAPGEAYTRSARDMRAAPLHKRKLCKDRPSSNRSKGGNSRQFVPWC